MLWPTGSRHPTPLLIRLLRTLPNSGSVYSLPAPLCPVNPPYPNEETTINKKTLLSVFILLLGALVAACAPAPTPTPMPPPPTAVPLPTAAPTPIPPSPTASTKATGPCTLVVSKEITAYSRPSTQATVFGKLPAGEGVPVSATTADGWIGFEPGVAQAANVGPFRLRWVPKSDAFRLEGACDNLPVIEAPPAGVCFQMFMEEVPIYAAPSASSAVVATARPGDYAQVIGASDKWLQLDLSVGSLKRKAKGWIERSKANFNGPCEVVAAPP